MRRSVITFGLFCLVLALGCGGSGSSGPSNSITIESIVPAAGGAGFTATVSYDLQTADSAYISHCYLTSNGGDGAIDCWMLCPLSFVDAPVGKGKGTITINDWKPLTGTKDLCVILTLDGEPNSPGVVSDEQEISLP